VKLATATTTLPVDIREQVQPGWHAAVSDVDTPEQWCCIEVRQVDAGSGRCAGPLVWHPHPRRVELDQWVTVGGWEYWQGAHRADEHPASAWQTSDT